MNKNRTILGSLIIVASAIGIAGLYANNSISASQVAENSTIGCSDNWGPIPFLDQSNTEFVYDLGTRYMKTITKTEAALVRSFSELDNLDALNPKQIVSYKSVKVLSIDDSYESIKEVAGKTNEFNPAQLKLLQSLPYSADVLIRGEYIEKNEITGELEDSYSTPHITIVPETQATYINGNKALLDYLRKNSAQEITQVKKGKLQPGKVRFTVSKTGTFSNVKLISSSGYDNIDQRMVELITNAPGTWNSALDDKGNPVEQQLIFSFGIVGC